MLRNIKEYLTLITELNNASNAYYNSDSPIMSDQEYDLKLEELAAFEKDNNIILSNSPTQRVGATILSSLKKVPITPKPMLSLDKCHSNEEVADFANGQEMIAMVKLDGLSVRIKYNNGKLISANTRGNGVEGTDITEHIKQFQNVPLEISYKNELIIDGEAIIKISDFEEINKNNEFKNPRNAAAGALNVLDTQLVKERKLSFIAWDVIVGSNYNLLSEKLAEIQSYGFEIVYFITNTPTDEIKSANNIIMSFKDEYPCDGVVWKFNDTKYGNSLGSTAHHFRNGIAWKPEIEVVESTLKNIDWTMGRTGILTPVAVFEPVELDGSIIERASLHNLSIMRSVLHGNGWVGQKIKIFKANMIIPQILSAEDDDEHTKPYIEQRVYCPICGKPLCEHGTDSIFLICTNPNCEGKLINRLDHFCGKKGLDIKGLSKATLEKLIDWEWVSNFTDIYKLSQYKTRWINMPGFGNKSVNAILMAIENSKTQTLESFISAIGIPLIGKSVAKEICSHVSTYKEFRELVDKKYNFSTWNTFGPEKCLALQKYDFTEADDVAKYINFIKPDVEEIKSKSLNEITVVITGKLNHYKNRATLQKEIEDRGGRVTGSVTSKTNYLINNDNTSTSSKNIAAKRLGVEIINEENFIKKFLH